MIIPKAVRKCVAFVGYQMHDGSFRLAGSAFFVGKEVPGTTKASPVFAVTARHVIKGIKDKGLDEVWFRVNLIDGRAGWAMSKIDNWFFHPTDESLDVAVIKTGIGADWDHLVISDRWFIDEQRMKEHEVNVGDEVFITGLFHHHYGADKNVPIVRVGNIACLDEEKVKSSLGAMDAILIEARSIGGLSGSPVFLNLGIHRLINGQVMTAKGGGPIVFFLGMVHGHYDADARQVDERGQEPSFERVNTGIAVVVPLHSIRAVLSAANGSAV